jgi:para-aminobenzoate synthetase/4-amino-4-deoxychorismate lyase
MIDAGTLLLHDNAGTGGRSLLFSAPRRVLTTARPHKVAALLTEAEAALAEGWHVAGTLSYELGLLFEQRLAGLVAPEAAYPLLWLGIYNAPQVLDGHAAAAWLAAGVGSQPAEVTGLTLPVSHAAYAAAFQRVMGYIAAGDVYQVNLTMPARFRFRGDPVALYRDLCRAQPVAYGALLNTGEHHILSLSPELFVENRGGTLVTRPMKGTIARGATPEEDAAAAASLRADEKSRAENLMIVDLLRNDLGRVAEMGSVEVNDLFRLETYRSLHQMTSQVRARMRPGTGLRDVLHALFPCGSVTGAPKIRAMQIIHEVEAGPRGAYCGSLGHIAPNGDFTFNVAIRSAVIDRAGHGEIGIGGGIVADSRCDSEYDEARLKLRFFKDATAPPGLIETLLWNADGFWLERRHLDRLAASADALAIPCDRAAVQAALADAVQNGVAPLRVRLVLAPDGGIEVTTAPLPPTDRLSFALAPDIMASNDPLLRHKTTRRAIYDEPRAALARTRGVGEVVFRNERGELTEGSFTNLFVEQGGVLLTPPLACGLLPGTLRAELLDTGRAREAVVTEADLAGADAIYLGNSLRGLVPADWLRDAAAAATNP